MLSYNPRSRSLPYKEYRPHQAETIDWLENITLDASEQPIIKISEMSTGCHPLGQGIMLFSGHIINVEDVKIGDQLMGPDGGPRNVIDLINGSGRIYSVTTINGLRFFASEDHVLWLEKTNEGNKQSQSPLYAEVSIRDYINWSRHRKHIYKMRSADMLDSWPMREQFIDPYVVGSLLGNGCIENGICLISMDKENINAFIDEVKRLGGDIGHIYGHGKAKEYNAVKSLAMRNYIKEIGMNVGCGSKSVPYVYKYASIYQRREILAGLLDTDGSLGTNCYDFISKSKQLSDDVAFLSRSLGLSARVVDCVKCCQNGFSGTYRRVCISGDTDIIPCRVPRKIATPRRQIKNTLRSGFTVEYIGEDDFYGFTLDGDGLYLLDNFIITHNSGKSAIAMAVGGRYNAKQVIALTHTRNLQKQYQAVFPDCFVHWGRASYPCIHDYRVSEEATADACLYPSGPKQCEYYGDCPYYIAKARSTVESRVALNYAYWLTSKHIYNPKYLILDEAHMLSDITLEHVGTAVSEHDLKYWQLPPFPKLTPREIAIYTGEEDSTLAVGIWLVQASAMLLDVANNIASQLENNPRIARTSRAAMLARSNNARRTSMKLETVAEALHANPGAHWFIRCDASQGFYMGKPETTLVIRPVTARHDFGSLFNKPSAQMLLMSATIGNVKVYAEELGIAEYDWRVVPNRWQPETRPVYALPVPSMGRRSVMKDDTVWQVQADMIAKAILEQPKHWCGFILVTRKAEVLALSNRLAARGLADRIYPMVDEDGRTVPTEQQLQMWSEHKQRVPNAIGVSCNFWTGVDGTSEKILIVAKVPFPSLASDFEKARMSYSSTTFNWRTACLLEQGLGRTRRGNYQDYEVDGLHQGYCAIADNDWNRTKSYLSQSMLDAIIELPKR